MKGWLTLSRAYKIDEFGDKFGDIGYVHEEYHVKIDGSIKPVTAPPRRVPLALREKLKTQLDETKRQDVIAKVAELTKVLKFMILVQNHNEDLRVCIDPQLCEDFYLRTLEACYFTKLMHPVGSGHWTQKVQSHARFQHLSGGTDS
ncbi:retrovirus-related Pol polyprotein from transposon 297-like Protein [Elysia marginata]|uniref:Retrovirus-related Pol polyprotein from transposon 297-like Protein n=1 Tax=Elysia marginata TaxID=1093978 RepID=A0AAV4FBR0_9GAST|nr:retrovirus-related Pol polyprotein from transposon 297-like Protein [Elysia marginata]